MAKKRISDFENIDCSVIIPHFNQQKDLAKCLVALQSQETSYRFEVIIIDNMSDGMEQMQQQFNEFNWVTSPVRNPYTSRNLGIQCARGQYLGFLDARCVPQKHWLQNGIFQFKNKKDRVIAGHYEVIAPSEHLRDQVYGLLYLNNDKNVRKGYGATGGNLFVSATLFELIGLFADKYVSGNDIEWTRRAMKRGYALEYAADVIVHYQGQTYKELIRKIPKYAVGIRTHHKNLSQKALSVLTYLLPMRFHNFQEALDFRNLNHYMWTNKCYLWILVWIIKMRMAMAYLFHR